ncbi:TolC family protein [Puia sp.]|jgi:outer membrane protein TolC|uniref:TolC family protein n=1 Tax=Puia sp. TaxID=2045100 RepID=UPI002F3FE1E8
MAPKVFLLFCLLPVCRVPLYAQDSVSHPVYSFSLNDVIRIAKDQNKRVKAAREDEKASAFDLQDAKDAVLPYLAADGNYQRYTKVTLFQNGLSDAHAISRPPDPNSASLVTQAGFLVYAGGRVRRNIEEKEIRSQLAVVNTGDEAGQTSTQAALLYLQIIGLYRQDSLVAEQIKRAELRVKNIRALYENERVTKSDLLRAEVDLSTQQLNREQTDNDITIAKDKLAIQLDLPGSPRIIITDTAVNLPGVAELPGEYTPEAPNTPYLLQKYGKLLLLQENRIDLIRSQYSPTVQLYSAYGLNYPNLNLFPPINQWWSAGFIGVMVHYDISSLYHTRNKMAAARQQYESLHLQRDYIADNVNEEIRSLTLKYRESLDRITVARKSIEQAAVNLRILSAKYYNQLALLTDLLDADNLYTESALRLVRAQTDAMGYYYRLLYATGRL